MWVANRNTRVVRIAGVIMLYTWFTRDCAVYKMWHNKNKTVLIEAGNTADSLEDARRRMKILTNPTTLQEFITHKYWKVDNLTLDEAYLEAL